MARETRAKAEKYSLVKKIIPIFCIFMFYMKLLILISLSLLSFTASGQNSGLGSPFLILNAPSGKISIFFKSITFDSTYAVIGIGPHWNDSEDNLERFCFILDKTEDLLKLKQDWVFNKKVTKIGIENNTLNIFVTKEKDLIHGFGMIQPVQGIIKSENNWYKFDTTELLKLHKEHPLKYHTQKLVFDTHLDFSKYYSGIMEQPSFMFLFEPYSKYEGKFIVTANRTSDPDSPIFSLNDLNKELSVLVSKESFNASIVINDSFNLQNRDKVKLTVEYSKELYGMYKNKKNEKGEWQPAKIETKVFWRD